MGDAVLAHHRREAAAAIVAAEQQRIGTARGHRPQRRRSGGGGNIDRALGDQKRNRIRAAEAVEIIPGGTGITRMVKAAPRRYKDGLRICWFYCDTMNVGIDAAVQRFKTATAVGRAVNSAFFHANIDALLVNAIEGNRADVRNM